MTQNTPDPTPAPLPIREALANAARTLRWASDHFEVRAAFAREAERKARNRLFNCCTDEAAPDWSLFSGLEVRGCIKVTDEQCEYTESSQSDEDAQFWTIYGCLKEGGWLAITDCVSRAEANMVAAELTTLSGLGWSDGSGR